MNKETIRGAITAAAGALPLKKRVLLESSPDLACNVYPVFRAMLDDPAFADVELMWLVKDSSLWRERYPQKNVTFVDYDPDDRKQKLRAVHLALTSKCVLFCNKTLWPPRKGQLSLFLGHGTPIKQCKGFYTPGKFCNRWSYPSEAVKTTMEEQLGLAPEQGLLLGYPRNDALLRPAGALDKLVDRQGRRCVFWLPTFRQHTHGYDSNYALPGCGLPLLGEEGALERLNAALEAAGVLLVLKPHPVQDMGAIKAGNFSNFRLLYDADLQKADVQLYEALADADALLTDYSSVYCDYLLTGKPIGLTFDDLERYEHSRGLVTEDVKSLMKGRYLYTPEDLLAFIGEVSRGEDPARAEREAANDYYNHWRDGGSARRVADYIRTFFEKGTL
ncbi:MAG: CDP-glycerol glycerophosphotransferase family protein [Candidatus Enterenecus sp.]